MGWLTAAIVTYALYSILPAIIFWPVIIAFIAFLWRFTSTGMSVRQKIAISTWSAQSDSNIYTKLEIDCTNLLKYIKKYRDTTGKKVTATHVISKAVAHTIKTMPRFNGRILWGRYLPKKTADISILATVEGGDNLVGVTISDLDNKSMDAFIDEMTAHVTKLRAGKDKDFNKSVNLARLLPTFLLRPVVHMGGFLASAVGLDLSAVGIKRFPFGTVVVTNMGSMGIDEAYAPFSPFFHTPCVILVGAISDKVVAHEGEIVIRPRMNLNVTLDHRYLDGFQAAKLGKLIRKYVEDPETLEAISDKKSQ
mmetsp:Transcript_3790/g.4201  ORF Transcript_3790/g.4201 Transcript_3790/m.4201 type:complete len:308 (+) Transcript_3790:46-969(+)